MIELEDLMQMDAASLHQVMQNGHALDEHALAETQYLGVDLSLPPWLGKLLWKTFRKTFHRDPETGVLRGWNVKLEQHGVQGPIVPLTNRAGQALSFGHYHVRVAEGIAFPKAWTGAHFLDYGIAGNPFFDLARVGYTPLVAVNEDSQELLLGWEVIKLGGRVLPLPLYWALRRQGPLEQVLPVPSTQRSA